MLRQNSESLAQMWAQWITGVQYEINFWDNWLGTGGGRYAEDFNKRMVFGRPVDSSLAQVINRLPKPGARILDVGAGPITCLGSTHDGYDVEIFPTDALAGQYDELLAKHNLVPEFRTVFALGEDLELFFGRDSFDIVHCKNALDHAIDPIRVLLQMLTACRVGGYVMLRHAHNEAENEKYSGFHQWNLTLRNGDFIVWNRESETNFSDEVGGFATHEVLMSDGYLINLFRKRADVPGGLSGNFLERIGAFQSAVVGSLGKIS